MNETHPYPQEAHHLLWETEKQTCRWQHSAAGAIREKWAQGRGAPGGSTYWLRQEDDMDLDLEGWVIPCHSGSATELVAAPHHPAVHDLGADKSLTRMMPGTALRKREEDSSQTVAFCSMPTTLCLREEREGFSQGCSGRVGEQYQNLHAIWLMLQKIILNIRIIEKKEIPMLSKYIAQRKSVRS